MPGIAMVNNSIAAADSAERRRKAHVSSFMAQLWQARETFLLQVIGIALPMERMQLMQRCERCTIQRYERC